MKFFSIKYVQSLHKHDINVKRLKSDVHGLVFISKGENCLRNFLIYFALAWEPIAAQVTKRRVP